MIANSSFLDDVIVFSPTAKQHLVDLAVVLGLLSRSNVSLKLKKCQLFLRELKSLGHIVSSERVRVDTDKTAALQAANPPRTRTQVRYFLGLANVYRRFVPDFSRLSRPLTQLLKKIDCPNEFAEFDLSPEQLEAFNILKAAIANPPVLAIPEVGDELRSYWKQIRQNINLVVCFNYVLVEKHFVPSDAGQGC
jgi:hypothetical protein